MNLLNSKSGLLGLVLVIFWFFIAVFGSLLAPYEVGVIVSYDVFEAMSGEYLLGTDYLGRDVLSRILHGARLTIGLAFTAALLAGAAGTILGLLAAVSGGLFDQLLSRFMDALISIPSKIFALVMIAAFGSSFVLLLIITGVAYTPGCYRIARAGRQSE